MLKFCGITIDTSGELRPLKLKDGWYVIGLGYCIPVKNLTDAYNTIEKLK